MVAEEWDSAIAAFSNIDATAPTLLRWTAATKVSQAYSKKGDKQKSVETISQITKELDGTLKEQGLLTLALLQEENSDVAGAKVTIDELLQLNQASEFIVLSNDLVERLAQRSLNDVTSEKPLTKIQKKKFKIKNSNLSPCIKLTFLLMYFNI